MVSNSRLAELLIEQRIRLARDSFWEYRKLINPKMKRGWWQKEIADELQVFYEEYKNGNKPKLVIQAPPQHGKSVQIVQFISWLAGKDPDARTIYTSFSERLGIRANLMLQRIYDSDVYRRIFPDTIISSKNAVTISAQNLRNREIVEYVGREGFFRNTTVRGSITGESLDLGVIDDPIKGRQDANSETVRNAAWDWFTDDFFTRFSEDAGLLAILTRWHVDDPIGRLIDRYPDIKVLSYSAVATKDERHRNEGEPLFPEHKSLEFLLERKKIMPASNWEALYQQNPYITDGGIFKSPWWGYYTELPSLEYKIITADTAQKTKEQNDYSVFSCWGKSVNGQAVLIDRIKGKWEAPELLVQARAFWNKHKGDRQAPLRAMYVEDKSSGTGLIQTIKSGRDPIPVIAVQRNTDKITRAMDVAPFAESGRVLLPKNAEWLSDWLTEHEQFPNAKHDDQVDTTIDAINELLGEGSVSIWDIM